MIGLSRTESLISIAIVILVVAAVVALPGLRQQEQSSISKVTDRLDRLEAEQQRLGRVVAVLGSDLAAVDVRSDRSAAQLDRMFPSSAVWLDLRGGGNAQWDLAEHGTARIEFLGEDDDLGGMPKFRVSHRAAQLTLTMQAGQTVRAVDDQGARQISYLTTMHRLRLDRSGRPDAALFSVVAED